MLFSELIVVSYLRKLALHGLGFFLLSKEALFKVIITMLNINVK